MHRDLKSLGSYLEHQDVRSAQNGFEGADKNGARPAAVSNGIRSEDLLLECGSPSDVLECTRAEIFDEVLRMRDDERQRIGQELHDSAGQLLLSLQLDVARLRESEKNSSYDSLILEIEATARLIGQEIRSLGFLNHPIRFDPAGLVSALQALIAGFGRRTGYRVSFKVVGAQPVSDRSTSMTLLRVAQEALVNIHRHAHASSVKAQLERRGSNLELAITDNGIGIPPPGELAINGGVGVQGMQFRVEQLGGRFRIAKLKRGTKIFASVPLAG